MSTPFLVQFMCGTERGATKVGVSDRVTYGPSRTGSSRPGMSRPVTDYSLGGTGLQSRQSKSVGTAWVAPSQGPAPTYVTWRKEVFLVATEQASTAQRLRVASGGRPRGDVDVGHGIKSCTRHRANTSQKDGGRDVRYLLKHKRMNRRETKLQSVLKFLSFTVYCVCHR